MLTETEWDYSDRKGRDGQKKKIGKANERKGKVKGGDEEVNGQGGRGVPRPHTGQVTCVQMCERDDGGGIHFDGVASRLTSLVYLCFLFFFSRSQPCGKKVE